MHFNKNKKDEIIALSLKVRVELPGVTGERRSATEHFKSSFSLT